MNQASDIVAVIDSVMAECKSSQMAEKDFVMAAEIDALIEIRKRVLDEWPLSPEVKRSIQIGAVAAKNLADWSPLLATRLMKLDYSAA